MNSVHEQLPQTVTANSALSQNWVGCTLRTPKAQVARTLRAQCPGRGRCCAHNAQVWRMSRVQPAQVVSSTCSGRAHSAQVVGACRDLLPLPSPRPSRDIVSRSRPPGVQSMSRHHSSHSRLRPPGGVATPILCPHRCPCRDIKMMSRHRA